MVSVIMQFIAKNPPSILILAGILLLILYGFTGIQVFSNWSWILILGVILQILWLLARYPHILDKLGR